MKAIIDVLELLAIMLTVFSIVVLSPFAVGWMIHRILL